MSLLGAALGWKFKDASGNDYPGIDTRQGVITKWPAALGPQPTAEQCQQIVAEYEAAGGPLADFPERTDLRQQAVAAVQSLDNYLAIADSATPAQVREQVNRLSQMMRRVIVRLVQID